MNLCLLPLTIWMVTVSQSPKHLSHQPTDIELLDAWKAGTSEYASNDLVRRYYKQILRYFATKISDGATCEDLTQETFVRLHTARDNYAHRSSFKAFLFGIANNVFRNYCRSQARTKLYPLTHPVMDSDAASATQTLAEALQWRALRIGIRGLSHESKDLLELYYWENKTGRELAQILDIPEATVRTRVHKIRTLLRQSMATPGVIVDLNLERELEQLERLLDFGPRAA